MTFLVHGYNFDPADRKNRADPLYDLWDQKLRGPVQRFHWYSGRSSLKGRWRALQDLYWRNTYAHAYDVLAPQASIELIKQANERPRTSVICHSLGSRVVLLALERRPDLFDKVLILNGAEIEEVAAPIMEKSSAKFLNIAVHDDDVLRYLGGLFCPRLGYDNCIGNEMRGDLPENVGQIVLDDKDTQEKYLKEKGWRLAGDNPEKFGDHWFSYTYPGNWMLYCEFLYS